MKSSGIKVFTDHPLGIQNVYTKYHRNPSTSCWQKMSTSWRRYRKRSPTNHQSQYCLGNMEICTKCCSSGSDHTTGDRGWCDFVQQYYALSYPGWKMLQKTVRILLYVVLLCAVIQINNFEKLFSGQHWHTITYFSIAMPHNTQLPCAMWPSTLLTAPYTL